MRVIITGVCGFIGSCLARRLMEQGTEVIGIDNLSRRGAEFTAMDLNGKLFTLHPIDLSHASKVFEVFSQIGPVDAVFHLAAQVAVTTSYLNRHLDFLDNAVASFHVIEAVKRFSPDAFCLYSSTNKVYGCIKVAKPVGLDRPLDPYTPYGVSKATGELYFTEYGRREFGLSTLSLRQSCIYGHHQFGVEDQGWIAWFTIANILGMPITIYGDGEQVRDLLFIDDLVELYLECLNKRIKGVYPVGGGPSHAVNLKQSLEMITKATGKKFSEITYDEIRPGDQPYFVADLSWTDETGLDWKPKTGIEQGLARMVDWVQANMDKVKKVLSL